MDTENLKSKLKLNVPPWVKKAAPVVVIAVIFGVVGYFITPQNAQSALRKSEQDLGGVRSQLAKAVAQQKKLDKQLARSEEELASAVERAAAAAKLAEADKTKVAVAEKFIAQLNEKLDQARSANEPLMKSLVEAKKIAADRAGQIAQARSQAKTLTTELAAVCAEKQKLDKANKGLQTERAELAGTLASQRQRTAELKRLLTVLDLGAEPVGQSTPAKPVGPAEMPITSGELIRRMGYPTLVFQQLNHVEMQWDDRHTTVRSVDGLVTSINGKAAVREVLASVAPVRIPSAAPPGSWRFGRGQKLYYADLVAMFGRPQRVVGKGGQFKAFWPVGAWARTVSAAVVDGVVTEFDGRRPDAKACCELVRQSVSAYKTPDKAVQANAAAAHRAYCQAVEVVGRRLAEKADLQAREGVKLLRWSVAPLESVGTWVGPANASAGDVTVRAWVDCTWAKLDGSTTDERRYVVVTLSEKSQPTEWAIFAPQG